MISYHARCGHCGALFGRKEGPLTPRQFAIYEWIARFIASSGFAPSFEEIADALGYRSLASIHEHLQGLERKGWIRRRYREARSIECLVPLEGAA